MSELFKLHNVFSKSAKQTAVFRVFEDLNTNLFHVQSCDFELSQNLSNQLIELFTDKLPSVRSEGFPSIAEAVERFKKDFE